MKDILETLVREALEGIDISTSGVSVKIERPADPVHGDFSTNAALVFGKINGIPPRELAGRLVEAILTTPFEDIKNIEIAGSGFINFFLEPSSVRKENEKEKSFLHTKYSGKKVLVEHSSPNLFKPFHIGHLMNNIVGEFVVRAVQVGGGNVTTMSFPSDVSLGIAKAMYILLEDKKSGKDAFTLSDEQKIIAFGEAYTRGVQYFDAHPDEIEKAKEIARVIYDTTDTSSTHSLFEEAKKINNAYYAKIIREIGSVIDEIVYESEAGQRGQEIVEANLGEGKVFTKSEGAVVYVPDESRKDLHTQVFINSEGYPTYEAKDLGLIDIKFSKFSPDLSFFITDTEQTSHFKIVLDAALKLGGEWTERVEKSIHIPHGRMLFKGQKMSSRLGGVPLALDVISVIEEEVRGRAGEKIAHLDIEEKRKLEREIALSALRITVLRSKPGSNINFDPESSLSFDGDSGPYLLYTHARCAALLRKGNEKGYKPLCSELEITSLERSLLHYESELADAVNNLAPQKLTTYLFEVAQELNGFYERTQILTDDKKVSEHHLAIIKRTKAVLAEGLHVLGVSAPERM